MSITLRDLLPRVMMYRPELDDAKGMFALTEAARRLGQNAAILRYPSIHNACTIGEREFVVGTDSEFKDSMGNLYRVENIAMADIPEGLSYAGPWNAATNEPYLGDPTSADIPATWANINNVNDPLPLMTAPVMHTYGNAIMMYGKAFNTTAAAYRTAIKVYYTDTNTWNPTVLWINENTYRQCDLADTSSSLPLPETPNARTHPVTPDGRALIVGGLPSSANGIYWDASWIYDFNTHTVSPGPIFPTTERLSWQTWITDLKDGTYLVMCGSASSYVGLANKAPYIWSYGGNMVTTLSPASATSFDLYAVRGRTVYGTSGVLANIWSLFAYDIDSQSITSNFTIAEDVNYTFRNPAYVNIGNYIYSIGGAAVSGQTDCNYICRFNPATNTITKLVQIPYTNNAATWASVSPYDASGNTILVFNSNASTDAQRVFTSYDVSSGKVSRMPTNKGGRKDLQAGLIVSKNNVYAFNGSGVADNTHEKYMPFTPKNTGNYYTVSEHGTTTKGEYSQWDKGDVIYNDGVNWKRIRLDKFVYIQQMNDPGLNNASATAEFGDGIPQSWWQRNGRVFWTVRPDRTYPVRLDLSYAPIGNEIASIDIPAECESVLVDGALSMLYSLPGQNMSPQLAAAADMRFKKGMATVRAIGMFGYGGTPQYYSGTAFGPQWNTIAVNWMER